MALFWHLNELTAMKRFYLIMNEDNSITNWVEALVSQFKSDITIAQKTVFTQHYTFENVFNHCEPWEYTNKIIKNIKSAMFSEFNQMMTIRNEVMIELKHMFSVMNNSLHMNSLLTHMNLMKTD